MPDFTLQINGSRRRVTVSADTPLLWVLRDRLGLTGTKYGCGAGLCGACTVHLDGQAVRSCVPAGRRGGGKAVTTIEGLSTDGTHPVQRAWIEEDVPQCGYCQAGQIMAAAALLAAHAAADRRARSTPRCPATCAAAGPTCGSARPSTAPPAARAPDAPRASSCR